VHDQRGDMMNGWIIRLLLVALVFGLVVYEVLALAVPSLTMDTAANPVVDAAVSTYRSTQDLDAATEAADHRAIGRNLQVVEVTVEGDRLAVTVMRQANTLVIHRIPGLEGLRDRHHTDSRRWRP
jgi:hypothetical protein